MQWDEEKLKETEKTRGTFDKIDEPKTPYRKNSDVPNAYSERLLGDVGVGEERGGAGAGRVAVPGEDELRGERAQEAEHLRAERAAEGGAGGVPRGGDAGRGGGVAGEEEGGVQEEAGAALQRVQAHPEDEPAALGGGGRLNDRSAQYSSLCSISLKGITCPKSSTRGRSPCSLPSPPYQRCCPTSRPTAATPTAARPRANCAAALSTRTTAETSRSPCWTAPRCLTSRPSRS